VVFCFLVAPAYGQGARDLYKLTYKIFLTDVQDVRQYENNLNEAVAEFDLFKGSEEAQRNPEFTLAIENALKALVKQHAAYKFEAPPIERSKALAKAKHELNKAKIYLK
jgi:hypothetical protein